MPYVVIYVESQDDVEQIVFNDEHGNTQYIGSWGEGIGFQVMDVLHDWSKVEDKETLK